MVIEFMFNSIKNVELIYTIEETYDEDFVCRTDLFGKSRTSER